MGYAYLTIDDGPSAITGSILDYLNSQGITPIMFFVGTQIELNYEQAVNALKQGAIVGNHSYSHPDFNKLTEAECIAEIEKQEILLEKIYKDAGVERKYKIFRFPYGHSGGSNAKRLQEFLAHKKFSRIDDRQITYKWYIEGGHNKAIDVFWTFDFREYLLKTEKDFTLDTILEAVEASKDPRINGLLLPDTYNIVLMHDSVTTDNVLKDYYKTLIGATIDKGVKYIEPRFLPGKLE